METFHFLSEIVAETIIARQFSVDLCMSCDHADTNSLHSGLSSSCILVNGFDSRKVGMVSPFGAKGRPYLPIKYGV